MHLPLRSAKCFPSSCFHTAIVWSSDELTNLWLSTALICTYQEVNNNPDYRLQYFYYLAMFISVQRCTEQIITQIAYNCYMHKNHCTELHFTRLQAYISVKTNHNIPYDTCLPLVKYADELTFIYRSCIIYPNTVTLQGKRLFIIIFVRIMMENSFHTVTMNNYWIHLGKRITQICTNM